MIDDHLVGLRDQAGLDDEAVTAMKRRVFAERQTSRHANPLSESTPYAAGEQVLRPDAHPRRKLLGRVRSRLERHH